VILLILGIIVVFLPLSLTFVVLTARRLQDDITTSWRVIFVPVFIIDGLIFAFYVVCTCVEVFKR